MVRHHFVLHTLLLVVWSLQQMSCSLLLHLGGQSQLLVVWSLQQTSCSLPPRFRGQSLLLMCSQLQHISRFLLFHLGGQSLPLVEWSLLQMSCSLFWSFCGQSLLLTHPKLLQSNFPSFTSRLGRMTSPIAKSRLASLTSCCWAVSPPTEQPVFPSWISPKLRLHDKPYREVSAWLLSLPAVELFLHHIAVFILPPTEQPVLPFWISPKLGQMLYQVTSSRIQ